MRIMFLDITVEREVCPNNLAPTTSALVTLALGDALAVSLITARHFQPADFANSIQAVALVVVCYAK